MGGGGKGGGELDPVIRDLVQQQTNIGSEQEGIQSPLRGALSSIVGGGLDQAAQSNPFAPPSLQDVAGQFGGLPGGFDPFGNTFPTQQFGQPPQQPQQQPPLPPGTGTGAGSFAQNNANNPAAQQALNNAQAGSGPGGADQVAAFLGNPQGGGAIVPSSGTGTGFGGPGGPPPSGGGNPIGAPTVGPIGGTGGPSLNPGGFGGPGGPPPSGGGSVEQLMSELGMTRAQAEMAASDNALRSQNFGPSGGGPLQILGGPSGGFGGPGIGFPHVQSGTGGGAALKPGEITPGPNAAPTIPTASGTGGVIDPLDALQPGAGVNRGETLKPGELPLNDDGTLTATVGSEGPPGINGPNAGVGIPGGNTQNFPDTPGLDQNQFNAPANANFGSGQQSSINLNANGGTGVTGINPQQLFDTNTQIGNTAFTQQSPFQNTAGQASGFGGVGGGLNPAIQQSALAGLQGVPSIDQLRGRLGEFVTSDVNENAAARGAFGGSGNQSRLGEGLGRLNLDLINTQQNLQNQALGNALGASSNEFGQGLAGQGQANQAIGQNFAQGLAGFGANQQAQNDAARNQLAFGNQQQGLQNQLFGQGLAQAGFNQDQFLNNANFLQQAQQQQFQNQLAPLGFGFDFLGLNNPLAALQGAQSGALGLQGNQTQRQGNILGSLGQLGGIAGLFAGGGQ